MNEETTVKSLHREAESENYFKLGNQRPSFAQDKDSPGWLMLQQGKSQVNVDKSVTLLEAFQ